MNPLIIFAFLMIPSAHCSTSFNLPVYKHTSTHHYLTRLHLASTSPHPLTFILDLDSPFVWTHHHNPGPLGRVAAGSIDCLTANGHQNPPTAAASTCSLTTANPITGESVSGELVIGEFLFDEEAGGVVDRFLYVSGALTEGRRLPDGVDGVLGLGRKSRVSLISQLPHSISMTRSFSVCFSGGNGDGFVSLGRDTGLDEIKRSMAYTPMMVAEDRVTSSTRNNYYVNVKAMEINGRKLVVPPVKAKINSVVQYTTLSRFIYGTIMKGFEEAADKSGMIRASAVGGFELCYRKLEEMKKAAVVPVVEFVMQSELVRWRFDEKNVMVDVGNDTMCLGVVEGGEDDEVVVGGYMLEENLVEFDLETEMVGFSGSLWRRGTSCGKLSQKIALIAGAREIESI